jgi:hypothetical protein
VIPLLGVEKWLPEVRDDDENPGIVRVAAHATLAIVGKYYANSEDCWILCLTIGK